MKAREVRKLRLPHLNVEGLPSIDPDGIMTSVRMVACEVGYQMLKSEGH